MILSFVKGGVLGEYRASQIHRVLLFSINKQHFSIIWSSSYQLASKLQYWGCGCWGIQKLFNFQQGESNSQNSQQKEKRLQDGEEISGRIAFGSKEGYRLNLKVSSQTKWRGNIAGARNNNLCRQWCLWWLRRTKMMEAEENSNKLMVRKEKMWDRPERE